MVDDAKTPEQIAAEKEAEKRRKEVEAAILAAMLFLLDRVTISIWWFPATWAEFGQMLGAAIDPATNAGDAAAKYLWPGYDSLDPQTVDAQRAYRDKFVQQTVSASKKAFEQAIAWGQTNGVSEADMNALLKAIAGTSTNQSTSILTKFIEMIDAGASAADIAGMLGKASNGALKDRAKILAGDALWSAVELGQLQAGRQEQRATNAAVTRTWNTALDERVCSQCGPLHGVTVAINDPFPGGAMMPPLHSNCRCFVRIEAQE